MKYLYTTNDGWTGQSNSAPTADEISSIIDRELDVIRFDINAEVFERMKSDGTWELVENIMDNEKPVKDDK